MNWDPSTVSRKIIYYQNSVQVKEFSIYFDFLSIDKDKHTNFVVRNTDPPTFSLTHGGHKDELIFKHFI